MKRLGFYLRLFLLAVLLGIAFNAKAEAQYTTVTVAKMKEGPANALIVSGELCARATDNKDRPITFRHGGDGQSSDGALCKAIANGVVTGLTLASPDSTTPSGIYYRFSWRTPKGTTVCKYVTWSGDTFNFDQFSCNPASIPTTGGTVTGNYTFTGNVTVNGTCTNCASDARMVWNVEIAEDAANLSVFEKGVYLPSKAITITRVVALNYAEQLTCSVSPVVRVYNGTTELAVTVTNPVASVFDSGALATNFPSGTLVRFEPKTAGTCSSSGLDKWRFTIEYKMQ